MVSGVLVNSAVKVFLCASTDSGVYLVADPSAFTARYLNEVRELRSTLIAHQRLATSRNVSSELSVDAHMYLGRPALLKVSWNAHPLLGFLPGRLFTLSRHGLPHHRLLRRVSRSDYGGRAHYGLHARRVNAQTFITESNAQRAINSLAVALDMVTSTAWVSDWTLDLRARVNPMEEAAAIFRGSLALDHARQEELRSGAASGDRDEQAKALDSHANRLIALHGELVQIDSRLEQQRRTSVSRELNERHEQQMAQIVARHLDASEELRILSQGLEEARTEVSELIEQSGGRS